MASSAQSPARRTEGERRTNFVKNKGVKHISYAEMLKRKARGLCFRCGEKFSPLHQCFDRQLRVLMLGDYETVNEAVEVVAIEIEEEKDEELIV